MICDLQHQAYIEESVKIREQIRQAPEEGRRVQLQKSAQDCQEERVHNGG